MVRFDKMDICGALNVSSISSAEPSLHVLLIGDILLQLRSVNRRQIRIYQDKEPPRGLSVAVVLPSMERPSLPNNVSPPQHRRLAAAHNQLHLALHHDAKVHRCRPVHRGLRAGEEVDDPQHGAAADAEAHVVREAVLICSQVLVVFEDGGRLVEGVAESEVHPAGADAWGMLGEGLVDDGIAICVVLGDDSS